MGAPLPAGGNYQMAGNTIVIPYLQTTPYDNHVTVYDPTDAKQYSDMLNMFKRVTLTRDGLKCASNVLRNKYSNDN